MATDAALYLGSDPWNVSISDRIGPCREWLARQECVREFLVDAGFHSRQHCEDGTTRCWAIGAQPGIDPHGVEIHGDGRLTFSVSPFTEAHPAVPVKHPVDLFDVHVALGGGDVDDVLRRMERWLPGATAFDDADFEFVKMTDDVAVYPPPAMEELITNFLAVGEVTALAAPRAIGKTAFLMQVGLACARGDGHLMGVESLRVTRPARVVMLQGELSESETARRWGRLCGARPPRIAQIFKPMPIKSVTLSSSHTVAGRAYTAKERRVVLPERLESTLTALDCDVLIIDPWAVYFRGDENSNDEASEAVYELTQMARRVRCAVLIAHHTTANSKSGGLAEVEDAWRGATRLADAVSTRVTIFPEYTSAQARKAGLDRHEARSRTIFHFLQRNGPSIPAVHARYDDLRWEKCEPAKSPGGRPRAASDEKIIDALKAAGGTVTSKAKLAQAVGCAAGSLDQPLNRLENAGVIDMAPGPRNALSISLR